MFLYIFNIIKNQRIFSFRYLPDCSCFGSVGREALLRQLGRPVDDGEVAIDPQHLLFEDSDAHWTGQEAAHHLARTAAVADLLQSVETRIDPVYVVRRHVHSQTAWVADAGGDNWRPAGTVQVRFSDAGVLTIVNPVQIPAQHKITF